MTTPPEGHPTNPYAPVPPPGSVPPPYGAAPVPSYGDPVGGPGYQPSFPGAPQPPRRGLKGWQVAAIATTTGVLGLAVGIGIGSAGDDDAPAATPTPIARTEEPSAEPAEDGATEAADDEAAEGAPADDEEGTRSNPYPVGTPVTDGEWEVTLGEPREGWSEIQAENQFNEAPAEGTEFYLVPVTATYLGDETGLPWMDLSVQFVGSDARTYTDSCGVIPGDLMDVDELYEGGVAEGNVCVAVPEGADGLWTLSTGWGGNTVFFTAAD
ncbi:hypothetical protein [Oceanitalea stevensii]|uniref:Uncharacterized protein n=1 Tax=Oceanitalea stevensii TaxID=2763072 RepID=A0ABR8Z1U4_9MICO|nr:hypothetical protein [Oceanitalea stevensii]MBD8062299.1 hypothetical protein [Oceanitalea stevensii]